MNAELTQPTLPRTSDPHEVVVPVDDPKKKAAAHCGHLMVSDTLDRSVQTVPNIDEIVNITDGIDPQYSDNDDIMNSDTTEEGRSVSEWIKDAYYRAGSEFTLLATGRIQPQNYKKYNDIKSREMAKNRRQMVAFGIGALACAKLGLDLYKAARGFQANFQTEFISDLVLPDIPEDHNVKRSKIDYQDMADSAIEYTHQGLETVANGLHHQPTRKRRTSKPKQSKVLKEN